MGVIDYWSGVSQSSSAEDVCVWLSRYTDGWVSAKGAHGYQLCLAAEGFRVYSAGQPGMGVYVQVSGRGCASVEGVDGTSCWAAFFEAAIALGCRTTRCDDAFDITDGSVSVDALVSAYREGRVSTHLRRDKLSVDRREGELVQNSWYLGRIENETSVCVYDKRLECLSRGEVISGECTRIELRLRGKRAQAFVEWVVSSGGVLGDESWLSSALTVYDTPNGVSGGKRSVASWWERLINNAGKASVRVEVIDRSLQDRAARWVRCQAATLAMFCLCFQNGRLRGPWLQSCLETGFYALNARQVQEVNAAVGSVPGLSLLMPLGEGHK